MPLDKMGNTKERTDWGESRIMILFRHNFEIPVGHPEVSNRRFAMYSTSVRIEIGTVMVKALIKVGISRNHGFR